MTTIPTWLFAVLIILAVAGIAQALFIYLAIHHTQHQKAMRNLREMRGGCDDK